MEPRDGEKVQSTSTASDETEAVSDGDKNTKAKDGQRCTANRNALERLDNLTMTFALIGNSGRGTVGAGQRKARRMINRPSIGAVERGGNKTQKKMTGSHGGTAIHKG